MKTNEKLNLTMLCDFYELTMGNGYFVDGKADQICYFDVFFRNVPDGGGFAIAAGLEQVVEYIRDLHFSEDDLAYLRGRGIFDEGFLHYLENFHFTGDIYAVPEGTPVFPREPILTVRAPAIEAQLVETYILLALNHQSLIATKANRVVRAAEPRAVVARAGAVACAAVVRRVAADRTRCRKRKVSRGAPFHREAGLPGENARRGSAAVDPVVQSIAAGTRRRRQHADARLVEQARPGTGKRRNELKP